MHGVTGRFVCNSSLIRTHELNSKGFCVALLGFVFVLIFSGLLVPQVSAQTTFDATFSAEILTPPWPGGWAGGSGSSMSFLVQRNSGNDLSLEVEVVAALAVKSDGSNLLNRFDVPEVISSGTILLIFDLTN
jgi:hypothetical protein